jgi:hypothetical protein
VPIARRAIENKIRNVFALDRYTYDKDWSNRNGGHHMDGGTLVGVFGLLIGIVGIGISIWQRAENKRQGSNLMAFLIGLKRADLSDKTTKQINDMLGRLK